MLRALLLPLPGASSVRMLAAAAGLPLALAALLVGDPAVLHAVPCSARMWGGMYMRTEVRMRGMLPVSEPLEAVRW